MKLNDFQCRRHPEPRAGLRRPSRRSKATRASRRVKEVIVAIRANNRQGTHSTKTRGEVRGGGKKPWRQKGTGRARAGSIRSPLWGGGGVVFGPKPRDYSKKINAKVKALAFSRALFDRAAAGEIAVIEAFAAEPAKTKAVNQVVGRIAPAGKVLLVDAPFAADTRRAARNIEPRLPPGGRQAQHRSISRSTGRSSSAPRRSRRSSPASTEERTDECRPRAQDASA